MSIVSCWCRFDGSLASLTSTNERNAPIADTNPPALQNDILGPEAASRERSSHAERWHVPVGLAHERRNPPRWTVRIDHEEVVPESRRRRRKRVVGAA